MAGLKIKLFGEFRVWRAGDLVENGEWGGQKTRSLLKLLLTRPGRIFSRDEIIEALWPHSSPSSADQRLRTTVSLLRRALEPDLKRGSDSRYILSKRPGYAFDPQADCRVDAREFEEHRKKAEIAHEAGEIEEAVAEYRAVLDLVEGEFLAEDPYEEWAVEVREEWQERYLDVLSKMADCLAQKGLYTQAVEACKRALTVDKYGEDLHRRLMLYHYCAGEQALALQAYRDYAGKLEENLGTEPSPDLARLKERIEAREVPGVDEGRRRYPRPRRPLKFPYSLSRTHFVGREKELSLLVEWLGEVEGSRGGAVAVEGEAGVGKTRLVEEFLGYARSRGVRVLSGRCYERELGAPLEPVLDALDRVMDIDGIVSGASRSGVEEFDRPGQAGPYDSVRIYRALAGELVRESRDDDHRALVLFVDDLQWADPATLEFLSYLARRVSGERILLLFAYRREDAPTLSGWLARLAEKRDVATTLSLDRLTSQDVAQIISRMSSRGFGELPRLAEFLHRESEGNPFYAVEYLRWLIESGTVEIDSRRRISGLESEMPREGLLPSGVRSVIQARLGSLSEEARDLLELVAVIGRDLDLELLRRAAVRDEAGTLDTIRPLMASGLIVETAQEAYRFSHDKLRQALYEGTDAPRRRELHLRAAEALAEAVGEPAELAHHYLRAREWEPALENLVLAARRAEDGYAWETALENYARALEVAEKVPDPAERRFDLLAARERLLERMDLREERIGTVQEMLELAKRLGDQGYIAEAHTRRIGALAAVSDLEGAAKAGRTALAVFQELGDRAGEARVHREMGYVFWTSGGYTCALEANFRALRIHRELSDWQGEAGDAHNISQVYVGMDDHDQALRWAEETARVYQEGGGESWEVLRAYTTAAIHLGRGDLETALDLSLRAVRSSIESGRKNAACVSHSRCGTLYLRLGRPEEALEHFREAARLNREVGHTRDEGYSLMSFGVCLQQTGDPPGAAKVYRRAVEVLDMAYEESVLPEDLSGKADATALLAGVLHRSLDRPEEALDLYENASEIYRKLGDAHRLRELLLNLAGLRWRIGDLQSSVRDYEEALGLAREHGEAVHEVAALASLSVVYRDLGRLKESLRCGRAARDLLRDLGDPQTEAYVLTSLAESYERLGHHKSALSCLKRSLRLRRKVGDEEGEVRTLHELAGIYEKLGDANRARASSDEATRKGGAPKAPSGAERRS